MEKHLKTLLTALATISGASVAALEAKLDGEDADKADISGELATVLDAHKKKVKDQKDADKTAGYDKAKREVLTDLETKAKAKHGVESDKTGLELIDAIVAAKASSPDNVSEDVIKRSPTYLALENSVNTKVAEATKAAEDKVKELETAQTKKEQFATVKAKALEEFDKLNPVMPTDEAAATKRRNRFIADLEKGTNFELTPGGDILLLKADGKGRAEDEHGNAVKFSDHVKSIADDLGFEYKAASDRSSSGNDQTQNQNQNTGKKYTGPMPAKGEEGKYMAILADATLTTEAKQEVKDAWTELNK